MGEEEKVVNLGWVSLSKPRKNITIKVLNQRFFVSLRDLTPFSKDIGIGLTSSNGSSKGKKDGKRRSGRFWRMSTRWRMPCWGWKP
jgi:hypothetical protein